MSGTGIRGEQLLLVSREAELGRIDAALTAGLTSSGATLVIDGPPGIGKTTLLAIARERAAERGMMVLSARGTPLERDYAMGMVRQAFEPVLRTERDPEALFAGAAALARSAVLYAPDDVVATPIGVLHGLYWLTANLAERRALLLAVDDVHWGDEPSLRFLAYLARRVESLPVALVVAARPDGGDDPAAGLLAEVRADPSSEVVEPALLDVDGVTIVLAQAAGHPVQREFASACREATGGNPFLLAQLVRSLIAERVAFVPDNAGRVSAVAPPTVTRRVRMTLDRIGSPARALVRAIAVLGHGVELEVAAALAGMPIVEAATLAGELSRAGILDDAMPLRFRHPLLAGAVLSDLPEPERAATHARAAALLRARGADPERVALQLMHSPAAGDAEIVTELREAATRALRRGAPATAAGLLRRALAEPPASKDRPALLLALGRVEMAVGRTPVAAGAFEEAHRAASDSLTRGHALTGLFQAAAGSFADQRAMALLFETTVPEVMEVDRELGLRLWTLKLLAIEPGAGWEHAAAGTEQLTLETPGEALLAGHAALPIVRPDQTAAGLAPIAALAARHADALVEEGATPLMISGVVLGLAWTDQLDLAEDVLTRAIAIARRRGATGDYALAHQYRATVRRRTGSLRDAEADARTALAASGGGGWAGSGLGAIIPLVGSLLDQGAVMDAERELSAVVGDREIPDAPAMTPLLVERMRLRAAQGRHREAIRDWQEARRQTERHLRRVNASHIPALLVAAETHHALAEPEARDALLAEACELAEHWGSLAWLGEVRSRMARMAGSERAIVCAGEAVELLRRSPARLELARALVSLGELLRRYGRRVDSRQPLREGYELARRCGANGLAEHARAELSASGIRLRREALTGADSLTASERRVADLAAAGASNAEIAQALFLTVKTVEMHLTHAYRKLDIHRRSQLREALAGKP